MSCPLIFLDKDIFGIITKVRESKYFEKAETEEAEEGEVAEEVATLETEEAAEVRQPVPEETVNSATEEERVGEEAVRGDEVPSDVNKPQIPVSCWYGLIEHKQQ